MTTPLEKAAELEGSGDSMLPKIDLQVLRGLPAPWEALLLKVDRFPQSVAEGAPIAFFLDALEAKVRALYAAMHHQVFLQFWKLSAQSGSDVLAANSAAWNPEYGLGLWPGGRPPQGWNETLAMDAAAAIIRGDEPELPAHRLLRLRASADELEEAVDELRCLGVTVQTFSMQPPAVVDTAARTQYLPVLSDPRFQRQDFYLPLVDCKTLARARTGQQLATWLCGIDLYVRESPEDSGVLIVSRLPLERLLP